MTKGQARWRHIDRVLTPSMVKLIRESYGTIHGRVWAKALRLSEATIFRVRSGQRGLERKPMGGDRRSKQYKKTKNATHHPDDYFYSGDL